MMRRTNWGLSGLLVVGLCASVHAAPSPAGGSTPDVLKGPAADPKAPPTSPGVFGDPSEARPGKPAANARAKFDTFQKALAGLMKEGAPESLRLTDGQAELVRAIQHEFRQANEAFFREHQDEIRRIRRQTGDQEQGRPRERPGSQPNETQPGMNPGGGPPPAERTKRPEGRPADAMSPESKEELMRRLRALEEQRPDPGPFQARAWEVLREDQRAHLTKEMDREADEIAKRRGEERLKKEQEERAKSPGKAPSAPGKPGTQDKRPAGKNTDAAKPGQVERGGVGAGGPNAERLAQRLQITPQQAKEVAAILSAPPSADERGLKPEERIARRVESIPESVLPASKRGMLKQMLASRGNERGGERGAKPSGQPAKKDRNGDEARPPSVDEVKVPKP